MKVHPRCSIFLVCFVATTMWRTALGFAKTATTKNGRSSLSAIAADASPQLLNLSSVTKEDLTAIVTSWGHPKFRASQVWDWIRNKGVTNVDDMTNLPKTLRAQLHEFSRPAALQISMEQTSKDGTIKRAYACHDGQLIESVLMPYEDGRYTACISSQAGCAQGCVFCATGQMGFARQLTSDEIFEQVARFAAELHQREQKEQLHDNTNNSSSSKSGRARASQPSHGRATRLSNIVFMGMGEPLANYREVKTAVRRINEELGIGARRITISTVGIVPNIRKLYQDPDMPPVRLAVSLHCATDDERSALLPANQRYGGLDELMTAIREYQEATGARVTLEWALIEGTNDDVSTAQTLGRLVSRHGLRRDMVHVNVIPLNPTGGYRGSPSGRRRVNLFCQTLSEEFGIQATPRVRRGIDIDAGCGQLKSNLLDKGMSPEKDELLQFAAGAVKEANASEEIDPVAATPKGSEAISPPFVVDSETFDFDNDDFEDPEYTSDIDKQEAERLISLVKGTTIRLSNDEEMGNVPPSQGIQS